MVDNKRLSQLKTIFEQNQRIVFGFLFGSQVTSLHNDPQDWDFAVFWDPGLEFWDKLGVVEELRHQLAGILEVDSERVDLVDLNRAGLSISSSIVEHGVPLKGAGSLILEKFFQKVWALEEDFHWRLTVENRTLSG
jgi:hypothetical protein